MFNDSKSFYYSLTGDLTRSLLQQQQSLDTEDGEKNSLPLWKKVHTLFIKVAWPDSRIFPCPNIKKLWPCGSMPWIGHACVLVDRGREV